MTDLVAVRTRLREMDAEMQAETGQKRGALGVPMAPPDLVAGTSPNHRHVWTAAELLAVDFPEPIWVVPGLLPVGLAILAGRPKLGKSFLALQLSIAVGSGGHFLEREMERGLARYIALEDSARRMQRRLRDMNAPSSCGVDFAFTWRPLNAAGLGDLDDYLCQRKPRLVVVDTLTRAVTARTDWDSVGQVTGVLDRLQKLAQDYDCCILLVDHHKKGNGLAADLVDDVLGSTAKSAVTDTVWGLYRKRGEHGATLATTGRDIEEQTLKLRFDRDTRCWQLEDTAVSGVQAEIVAAIEDLGAATGDGASGLPWQRPGPGQSGSGRASPKRAGAKTQSEPYFALCAGS